jgi:hypothetical protein
MASHGVAWRCTTLHGQPCFPRVFGCQRTGAALVAHRTSQRAFYYGSLVRDCSIKRARQPRWRFNFDERFSGFP